MAWKAVCPSVLMFYDFALELETALCELLTVLCSPEMTALQHLEKQQVQEEVGLTTLCPKICLFHHSHKTPNKSIYYACTEVW